MPDAQVLLTQDISVELVDRVRTLLDDAFGGEFSDDDWDHARGGWHTIVTIGVDVVSHAAVVPRVMEIGRTELRSGYVEAVATAPCVQRSGYGSRAMTELMRVIRREFDVGLLSTGQHRFYEALGWERWLGPSFVVRDGQRVRTEGEDHGIMALRFGPSVDISLTAPVVCYARRGDDW